MNGNVAGFDDVVGFSSSRLKAWQSSLFGR